MALELEYILTGEGSWGGEKEGYTLVNTITGSVFEMGKAGTAGSGNMPEDGVRNFATGLS